MIFLVTNLNMCPRNEMLLRIREAALSGANFVLLRENQLSEEAYKEFALTILQVLSNTSTELIVCHRPQIAKLLNLKLHNRYSELSENSFSVSTHQLSEVKKVPGEIYCFYGHVFETDCKRGLEPRYMTPLKHHHNSVALGGVNLNNIHALKGMTQHIAMMSSWLKTEELSNMIKKMISYGY